MATIINAIASMMTTTSLVTSRSHSSTGRSFDYALGGRQHPDSRPASRSAWLRVLVLLEAPEHIVEVKAGGLLALRVFPECLQESPDIGLCRHEQIDVAYQPIVVGVRGNVGALEWICAKIENLRHAQGGKRLGPDPQCPLCPLLFEYDFPIIVAQSDDLLVVIAVDERDPRALFDLAGQVRHQIITVEVDLIGHVADFVALQELVGDLRIPGH